MGERLFNNPIGVVQDLYSAGSPPYRWFISAKEVTDKPYKHDLTFVVEIKHSANVVGDADYWLECRLTSAPGAPYFCPPIRVPIDLVGKYAAVYLLRPYLDFSKVGDLGEVVYTTETYVPFIPLELVSRL